MSNAPTGTKRIVIDARRLRSSTGRYVRGLLRELAKLNTPDIDFHLLVQPEDIAFWQPDTSKFTIHETTIDHYTSQEQVQLLSLLNSLKPDLVHFWMPQHPILYRGKFVVSIHDLTLVHFSNTASFSLLYQIKKQVFKRVIKHGARASQRVLTGAEYVRQDIANFTGVSADKIRLTQEAAEPYDELVSSEPVAELANKDFVFFVGNAFPYKNLRLLADAHAQVRKNQPSLWVAFVGKTDEHFTDLQKYCSENGYENVLFTDFIPDEQLAWMYKNARGYVFPSLSEGYGLPGIEAMQFGLPVASSNATCLPEIYGDAAEYFDPHSVDDAARAIELITTDETRRNELARLGKEQVQKYSWKRMAEETLAVYRDAVN